MKRRKPLARSGRLRRTQIKAKGKRTTKSGGHLFPKLVDEAYRAWIRGQPCVLRHRLRQVRVGEWLDYHHCASAVQACHVKSRGTGGQDQANLYPGCALAHAQQHAWGIATFQTRWKLDLAAEAQRLYEHYQAAVGS
jgi:hypothetical protein